jgi:hypothetical protein
MLRAPCPSSNRLHLKIKFLYLVPEWGRELPLQWTIPDSNSLNFRKLMLTICFQGLHGYLRQTHIINNRYVMNDRMDAIKKPKL